MKEKYGVPFELNKEEVEQMYNLLDLLDHFLSGYLKIQEEKDDRDHKTEYYTIIAQIQTVAFRRRMLDYMELNCQGERFN